jgi:hypothetical protein
MARPKRCNWCNGNIHKINGTYPDKCPICGTDLWSIPPIELKLKKLQDAYLIDRNEKDFGIFLYEVKKVLRNIIVGKLTSSGTIISDEELEDSISESLEKVIKLYSKPHFFIKDSFIGYLGLVVLYPMYNEKKQTYQKTVTSYHAPINSSTKSQNIDDTEKCLLDIIKKKEYTPLLEEEYYSNKLLQEILDFIDIIYLTACSKVSLSFGYLLSFSLKEFFSNKQSNFFDELYNYYTIEERDYFEKIVVLLQNFIRSYEKQSYE